MTPDTPQLYTLSEVCNATNGQATPHLPAKTGFTGVSFDTTTLTSGDLYIARQGAQRDGHDFIAHAFKQGAAAALVARGFRSPTDCHWPLIYVDDPHTALTQLALYARERAQKAMRIAITGSCGKTTVRAMLAHALNNNHGTIHTSEKSFNNHTGVPLSLARMPADTQHGIFEVGTNHPGEIAPLSQLVQPHLGILTLVAPAHLGNFPSFDALVDEKASLIAGIPHGGALVLEADSPALSRVRALARKRDIELITWSCQSHGRAHVRLLSQKSTHHGTRITLDAQGTRYRFDTGVFGTHWAHNALCVVAACLRLTCDIKHVTERLSTFSPLPGRGHIRLLASRTVTVIDDTYNANPASMAAALHMLGQHSPQAAGRRIAVLGDMKELGQWSGDFHSGLAPLLQEHGIALALLCGTEMSVLHKALYNSPVESIWAPDVHALIAKSTPFIRPHDILLVKGSRSLEMETFVKMLQKEPEVRHDRP